MQDEVIEEYSRPFPGEVVETYTRPLPASMAPAKPQAAKKPKRRRWRGFLLLLVIAAGITAVIGGGQWVLGMLRGAYTGEYDYYDRDWQEDTTDSPITIPTVEAAADAELTLTAGRTRTLTAQEVYQTVKDAVVTVAVDLGGGKMSVGTGILFREDGYFVTNQHVVAGGSACTVLLADGTPYEANYIASDADYDVAVLKIDGTGFPTADFGNSDTLEVGETVYAIGTPLNLEMGGTFTDGIVSSVNREMQQTAGTSMPLILRIIPVAVVLIPVVKVFSHGLFFKLKIQKDGFYCRTNPFDGRYYRYGDILDCCLVEAERGTRRHETYYAYYMKFTDRANRTHRVLYDKSLYEREMNELVARIERAKEDEE